MKNVRKFPCLPGFNFDNKIGKTDFHRCQLFEKIHDGVYYLAERPIVSEDSRYPSLYSFDGEPRIPSWIAYDGQRLMFQAFFQESLQERREASYQIRLVIISFFLEDGTIKIVEPAVDNSGLEQGVLVRRQRIPIPDSIKYRFYDILDLNVGQEVEIFGRVYKIVNCDKFTRIFLNRMGIAVPDPIDLPGDPCTKRRNIAVFPKKPNRQVDTLGKFLHYDRKVLRFYGYWDDTDSEYGSVHDLEIRYYLADDTIEIKQLSLKNSDIGGSILLKRIKIPKLFEGIEGVGAADPFTVLNVLGNPAAHTYFIPDSLNAGNIKRDYYKDNDLVIGTKMNIFGRQVVITDLDEATKDYYRTKYGIEEFKPLEKPKSKSEYCPTIEKHKPPPYNGYGSYDDSLANCSSIIPKPPKFNFIKFAAYDKQGYDSKVLSYRAHMLSNIPENGIRRFIIRVYLMDNTVSIFEYASRNTGFKQCLFQKRMEIVLPNQVIYSSEKPQYYEPQHFYIGAELNLGGFHFRITSADEYTLRYMELNCDKFSRANVALIIGKIRAGLKPVYTLFLKEYCPLNEIDGTLVLTYDKFKEALLKYLGDAIIEHELIAVARRYGIKRNHERNTREYLRNLIHMELKRHLWNDLDRLTEDINHWDLSQTGYLSPKDVYTIIRGCRLPLASQLINCLLNHLRKNGQGKIDCKDLLEFMNVKINSSPPIIPQPVNEHLDSRGSDDCRPSLNWQEFIKDLDIKEEDPVSAINLQ